MPEKSTLPIKQVSWPVKEQPCDCIYNYRAGPFEGHILLIIIDANMKWLKVAPVPKHFTRC